MKKLILLSALALPGLTIHAQAPAVDPTQHLSPATIPGNGLSRFDFFYAGEAKQEKMYIVRNGKIDWSYTHPVPKGEISDAVMLTNGNILFAHQYGITEITQDKKVVWNYDAPEGTEIHTALPIGNDLVLFLQNGNPAKLRIVNKKTNATEKEMLLPTGNPANVHGHFRHARLTREGTILVAHLDMGKLCEYDQAGRTLLSVDVPGIWSGEELANGNILITSTTVVREMNRKRETIWEYPFSLAREQGYDISNPQLSIRLSNGNTLINNWFNQWNGEVDLNNPPVQAIEVTPDKKIVWALRAWTDPANLGPSTTIIPLTEARTLENEYFGGREVMHTIACTDYTQGKVMILNDKQEIIWDYPAEHCNDLWVLANGNLLFNDGNTVKEVNREKQVVWEYRSQSDIYACQRLPNGNTFVGECSGARLIEAGPAGNIVKAINLLPDSVKGNRWFMRNARKLDNGHYLVAHYGLDKVSEYDADGTLVWELPVTGGPHSVERLPNGNTLVACTDHNGDPGIVEFNAAKEVVWQVRKDEIPGISLKFVAGFRRLPNGNTILTNWLGHDNFGKAPHAIEITPNKKVVWLLSRNDTIKTLSNIFVMDNSK